MKLKAFFCMAAFGLAVMTGCEKEPVVATGVTLDKNTIEITKGETAQLTATVNPDNAEDKKVTWTSSASDVATVDENGLVTAIETGSAIITVSTSNNLTSSCKVTVVGIAAGTVNLNKTALELVRGKSEKLTATVLPEDAEDKTVTWTSSDDAIATVDAEGNVTAVAIGNAEITATAGTAKGVCNVTVVGVPVESITLDRTSAEVMIGDVVVLKATVTPEDADYDKIEWFSSNEQIVMVDNGTVTAQWVGDAVVTAKIGDVTAQCSFTVSRPIARVGDFYYSDGTFSSQLDESKTPIGLVYYTGDPTVNDAALKADHPQCTNGLVVALDRIELKIWQDITAASVSVNEWVLANTSYADITDDSEGYNFIQGYNNTKAIEAFNAANPDIPVNAVQTIVDYRSEVEAPANTSGWYLPASMDCAILCSGEIDGTLKTAYGTANVELLNPKLEQIGADVLEDHGVEGDVYWTSTEDDKSYAMRIFFGNGSSNYVRKNANPTYDIYVRAILAF